MNTSVFVALNWPQSKPYGTATAFTDRQKIRELL
jgi:hypothetical protein